MRWSSLQQEEETYILCVHLITHTRTLRFKIKALLFGIPTNSLKMEACRQWSSNFILPIYMIHTFVCPIQSLQTLPLSSATGDISFLAQLTTSPRNSEHTEFSRNRKRQANKISKKNAFERLNSTSPTFYRLRCATPATPTISEAKDSRDH